MQLEQVLLAKIDPKVEEKFKDPFEMKKEPTDEEPPPPEGQPEEVEGFKFELGEHVKDTEGGDAGLLLKRTSLFPEVYFVRTQYCTKNSLNNENSASSRSIKKYIVTTGLIIAYLNSFEIISYIIQKPSMEAVPKDYSQDRYNKLIVQRKLAAKKKTEKSLA